MGNIAFFVPGVTRGKQRARVAQGRAYTPKETVDAERIIAWEGKKAMAGAPPHAGPVMLTVHVRYPYPKSWSQGRKERTYWKTTKPDLDNVLKLVSDALNKTMWLDDSQIIGVTASKYYVFQSESIGVEIEVGFR